MVQGRMKRGLKNNTNILKDFSVNKELRTTGLNLAMLMYNNSVGVGFEVLMVVSTKMAVFWVVAPCSLVEVYQRFRGPCCLHHQGTDGTTTQKTAIFVIMLDFTHHLTVFN
jgi:hypothetical protein